MNVKSNNANLIGCDVEIQLAISDLDVRQKTGQIIPELPKIQCRLLKRILTWTWDYIAELKGPLFLDKDGIPDEARKKISTSYIVIHPSYKYARDDVDNSYLQIMKKGFVDVGVFYLENPDRMPNELAAGHELDDFIKSTPAIASGVMTLKT